MNKLKDVKLIALLSYIWLLSLIPFLISNDNFVKYHAKQGIRLTIVYTPLLMMLILLNKLNFMYMVTDILISITALISIIYSLMGIIDVINNSTKELPFINKLFGRKYEKN